MPDHQHGLDVVGHQADAREELIRGGSVQLVLDDDGRAAERRPQELERLARSRGGRAEHELRLDPLPA